MPAEAQARWADGLDACKRVAAVAGIPPRPAQRCDLLNDPDVVRRRGGETGEDAVECAGPHVMRHDLGEYRSEVRSEREIAAFVELLLREARPLAVHFAALT